MSGGAFDGAHYFSQRPLPVLNGVHRCGEDDVHVIWHHDDSRDRGRALILVKTGRQNVVARDRRQDPPVLGTQSDKIRLVAFHVREISAIECAPANEHFYLVLPQARAPGAPC
jgi:hypothetical protein